MNLRAVICCVLAMVSGSARADEQVRRVQEELRKRNLYFGDVDGRKTAETRGAIRRYQERKGFAATGELSDDTLRSLEIVTQGNLAEHWPEGTVMKSDAARQIAEADRKMLEELNASAPEPPGESPLSEPLATGPEATAGGPLPPAKNPDPIGLGPDAPGKLPAEAVEETKAFVRDYLAACATNRLDDELHFYADRLNYFDHGTVDRGFVAQDVQRYYKRWPQRQYELLDFKLTKVHGEDREVTFRIAFRYQNAKQSVAGRSLNFFKVRQDEAGLHFTSLKEQRVRE